MRFLVLTAGRTYLLWWTFQSDKYCIFLKQKNILHLQYAGWCCHCDTLWELGNDRQHILLLSNFDCPFPKILQASNRIIHDGHLKHIWIVQVHQKLSLRNLSGSYLAYMVTEYPDISTTNTVFSSCMYLLKDTLSVIYMSRCFQLMIRRN